MSDFPTEYEKHLLRRWLESLLDTDRDYEARLALALLASELGPTPPPTVEDRMAVDVLRGRLGHEALSAGGDR